MPGTVSITRTPVQLFPDVAMPFMEIIAIAWIADAADGTVPSTPIPGGVVSGLLQKLVTNPGSPVPGPLYDITITDEDGFDVLGGVGGNRSATATEEKEIAMTTFQRPVANELTFALANNAINSGLITCDVVAAAKTFTRAAGSFLTDGFLAGQTVVTSGFTNAGNNGTKVIATVAALVLTMTVDTGLIGEIGDADERVVGGISAQGVAKLYVLK